MHIVPALGKIPLAKLSPQRVQIFLNELLASGLSGRSVQHIRTVLRTALNQALKWNIIVRNAAALTEPPRAGNYQVRLINREEARIAF
jgi:integrase